MRLEYLAGGSADCPLIRLYHFGPAEMEPFLAALTQLAAEAIQKFAVHEVPWVEAVEGCRLTLYVCSWDQAVVRIGTNEFQCGLTAATWDNVAGLVEPFLTSSSGFQWLVGAPGEARLLLSSDGRW